MKIIIIGTGVAGSVMADMLTKKGHKITLIEKDNKPGGMCKSYYKGGFTYEYGPHILAMHNCSKKSENYIKSKKKFQNEFMRIKKCSIFADQHAR